MRTPIPLFPASGQTVADAARTAEGSEAYAPLNLGSIAYENYHAPVFHAWLNLPRAMQKESLRDRYVFFSFSSCVELHLAGLLTLGLDKANEFVRQVTEISEYLSQGRIAYSEEWFRGLDQLVGAFTDHNYIAEARATIALAFRTGAVKFPRISQSLSVHVAYLDAMVGRRDEAANVALRLVRKPFLLPNRRELPALYRKLMYVLSGSNHLAEYKMVLWKGVCSLSANAALRDTFVRQIVNTYRGAFRALLRREIPLRYRLLFLLGNLARVVAERRVLAKLYVHIPLRWLHLGGLYLLDSAALGKTAAFDGPSRRRPSPAGWWWLASGQQRQIRRILVTRAMGGIGDLLMMTPGLSALAFKYPQASIDLAIPKSFHVIFEGFQAVRLLDVNEDQIDLSDYHRWINLTDCPAGRVESKQYPNVRRNRIEIFAHAMGISRHRLRNIVGFLPRYQVAPEEQSWAKSYLDDLNSGKVPVIGVQPFAADTYRNWPYMEKLVGELSKSALVLVFHNDGLTGYDFPNVVKVSLPLRKSVALAAQCSHLIVPDSSFLHFSAALGIPTVAIFGAISGKLRTGSYPNVHLLAPRKDEFPCYPCWRHEYKPCHLTNGRESICFRSVSVEQVIEALNSDRSKNPQRVGLWQRLTTWAFYGYR